VWVSYLLSALVLGIIGVLCMRQRSASDADPAS
jgi:hypothetical protein